MKILIINGSPRKKGYTKVLAKYAYEYTKGKYKADLLDLSKEQIEQFKGFEEEYSDKTKQIVNSLKEYDAFIICSPVYDGLLSSAIKNLFEHINSKSLIGKSAGFVVMAAGNLSYLQVHGQLAALMNYFSIVSIPKGVYVGHEAFNDKMELVDENIRERIERLVESTVKIKI